MEAAAALPTQPRTSSFTEEARQLFRLGWPLALAQAGQALFGVVDTAVVGRVGAQAQGAVGLGNGVFMSISVLGMGVMMALDPLISQSLGAHRRDKARTLFWQGVWLALITSAVLALPIALTPLLLPRFGVEPGLAHQTWLYAVWRLPQLVTVLLFIVARCWLQSIGRTHVLYLAVGAANLLNFALCWFLVLELHLGVQGAALATVASGVLQLGIVLSALGPAPEGTQRAFDRQAAKKTLAVGVPIGLQMFAEVAAFSAAGVIAGTMGETSIAAHQIAITWASFSFCLAVGVGAASAVRVGWAVGAGDTPGARRAGLTAMLMGMAIMSTSAVFFFAFPTLPAQVMSDRPDVLEVVVGLFAVTAVFQVFDGIQAVAAGALRGAGDTRFSFWANVLGYYAFGLPISVLLGIRLHLGVVGLWWGLCAGLIAVAVALGARFIVLTSRDVKAL
ncbi:MAG: MATE family efflux transporter [Archangiaceae bacterium]|nr:MATE family efflux transporter [Archangiaceae bacterium]